MHGLNSLKCSVTPYFLSIDHFLCRLSTFCEKLKKICVVEVWFFSTFCPCIIEFCYCCSCMMFEKVHLRGLTKRMTPVQITYLTNPLKWNLIKKVGLQRIIFNIFQLTSTEAMSSYAPINSKLQHPPPGHTPGIWLCIVPGEGGIWTLRWKGGEFEPDLSLVLTSYASEVFSFCRVWWIYKIEFLLC